MLNNFYTHIQTSQTSENAWSVHIRLNPEHPLYQGHFPEQPIVPGVCMLQFIKESVETILQERTGAIAQEKGETVLQESVVASSLQRLQYTQIASCKFLLPIDPVQHPELVLALELKEIPTPSGLSPTANGSSLTASGSSLAANGSSPTPKHSSQAPSDLPSAANDPSQTVDKPVRPCYQLQAEGRTGTDCFIKLKAQLASK